MAVTSPFDLLQSLDQRCRQNATGLPVSSSVVEDWVGIGFQIDGIPLLAKMDDVSEILPPPATIRVPGVRPWVKGLANVRGSLMPILDMNSFLNDRDTSKQKENRILIIDTLGVAAGLLVEEVYGLRRFKHAEHRDETATDVGAVGQYLSGVFVDQIRRWNVFRVDKLVKNEQFIRVV